MLPKASGVLSKRHRSQNDVALTGQRWDNMSIGKKKIIRGANFLVIQWLGLHTFTAKDPGLIPSQGSRISQAGRHSQEKKINF